jgi:hypothetical protein
LRLVCGVPRSSRSTKWRSWAGFNLAAFELPHFIMLTLKALAEQS